MREDLPIFLELNIDLAYKLVIIYMLMMAKDDAEPNK